MSFRSTLRLAVPVLMLSALAQANAQTVVVTTPTGTVTNPGGPDMNDPFAFDTWLRDNVRAGSTVGITNTYARSGNGSAQMTGTIANTSKADMEYYFGGQYITPFSLSSLSAASYEWLRNSSSTANGFLVPSLRFMIDEDGNFNTTTDRSILIYEPIYNGTTTAAVDTWVSEAINGTSNLWWRQFNPGNTVVDPFGQQLNAYQSATGVTSAGRTITGNSVVYGLSSGIGSGWNGTFDGAVDNIEVAYGNNDVTFNFETTTATPEPATLVLFATGFMGVVGFARKRRTV
ncbi:MAG: PEP-CTERM sorting domain-containing protein [Gemmatimonadaceae bacterium]